MCIAYKHVYMNRITLFFYPRPFKSSWKMRHIIWFELNWIVCFCCCCWRGRRLRQRAFIGVAKRDRVLYFYTLSFYSLDKLPFFIGHTDTEHSAHFSSLIYSYGSFERICEQFSRAYALSSPLCLIRSHSFISPTHPAMEFSLHIFGYIIVLRRCLFFGIVDFHA